MLCVSSDRKADIKVPLFPALPQWLPLDHLGRASSEEGEEGEQAGAGSGRGGGEEGGGCTGGSFDHLPPGSRPCRQQASQKPGSTDLMRC